MNYFILIKKTILISVADLTHKVSRNPLKTKKEYR